MGERAAIPRARRRWRSRLGKLALSIALTLVLLEVALWGAAWVVGGLVATRASPAPRADGARVVLCVGDSFTFGMGATSRAMAYPQQLERQLAAQTGAPWVVINGGRPGNDSLAVLEDLPEQLRAHAPETVCVIVGVNDRWRRRGRGGESSGFRLRTLDLLRIATRGIGLFRAESASSAVELEEALAGHPLVGRWRMVPGEVEVTFFADGRCDLGSARWRWRGGPQRVTLGDRVTEFEAALRVEAGMALIQRTGAPPLLLVRAADIDAGTRDRRDARDRLAAAAVAGDHATACQLADRLLAMPGLSEEIELETLALSTPSRLRSGDHLAAERDLSRLRALHAARGDGASFEALGRALVGVGRSSEAVELARAALAGHGEAAERILEALAGAMGDAASAAEAAEVLEAALTLAERVSPTIRAALYAASFRCRKPADRDAAVADLVRCWHADRASPATALVLGLALGIEVTVAELERAAMQVGLDDAAQRELIAAWEQRLAGRATDWRHALGDNLDRIVGLCHAAGAGVIVADYPFSATDIAAVQAGAARRGGATFVAVASRFPAGDAERAPLFVADGHCSDAGYAILAEAVAQAVVAAARR